jgi:hypothetical protein
VKKYKEFLESTIHLSDSEKLMRKITYHLNIVSDDIFHEIIKEVEELFPGLYDEVEKRTKLIFSTLDDIETDLIFELLHNVLSEFGDDKSYSMLAIHSKNNSYRYDSSISIKDYDDVKELKSIILRILHSVLVKYNNSGEIDHNIIQNFSPGFYLGIDNWIDPFELEESLDEIIPYINNIYKNTEYQFDWGGKERQKSLNNVHGYSFKIIFNI